MAVNRPPTARPQQERARHFRATSGVSNTRQPDTGPGCPSQDPGSTHHPNVSTRPVFYVPAPPPPQFLHYQWPIPFPYNPIAGFSGMGYGMIMPPFPPTPYMEAPAYVMPHPHADYRQFLHPMVHAQCPPYQNPNQTRRFRGPFSFSVRQTTNSEVQTEPSEGLSSDKEGSVHGDSGTGTASCSPSCRSSSQKQDSVEVEKCSSPSVDMDVQRSGKSSPSPAENKAVESCRETSEKQNGPANVCNYENGPPCKNDHCNIWSVSSQDGMVPMCSSSQQEDESIQERHVSVSDILKCWRAGAPQEAIPKATEKELFHNEHQLAFKTREQYEGPVCHTASKTGNGPRLLGYRREEVRAPLSKKSTDSQNEGAQLSNDFNESQENDRRLHENTSGSVSYKFPLSTPRVERKLNESVWSVESIGPFIPSKEWIMQNMPESQMVAEITEEPEDGLSKQYDIILGNCDGNQSLNPSTPDSAQMACLIYSTPAQKTNPPQTPRRNSAQSPEMTESPKEDPGMNPKKNEPLTCLQSDITPSGESGSPEFTANQNPNQNACHDVQQVKIPCIADQRETPSSSLENIPSTAKCTLSNTEAVKSVPEVESNDDLSNHQLCVLLANPRTAEFSPGSMGHCFCIGCHCNKFHESKYPFEELKPSVGSKVKHRAVRKGISMKARIEKKYGPWRNKRLAKYNNDEE